MQVLQRVHRDLFSGSSRTERFNQSLRAGHGRHAGHVVLQGRATNRLFVVVRCTAQRSVDYQSDLALLDVIGNVGTSFVNFEAGGYFQADFAQARRGSPSRHQVKTETLETPREQGSL